jgi:hypothetical protein
MKREKMTETRIALPLLASKTSAEKLLSLRSGAKLAPTHPLPVKKRVARGGKIRRVMALALGDQHKIEPKDTAAEFKRAQLKLHRKMLLHESKVRIDLKNLPNCAHWHSHLNEASL